MHAPVHSPAAPHALPGRGGDAAPAQDARAPIGHGGEPPLDLNLLPLFLALMDTRSITRAAARLHCSEGKVRRGLAMLRLLWSDPVFVVSGGALVPTPHALACEVPLRSAMAEIRRVVRA